MNHISVIKNTNFANQLTVTMTRQEFCKMLNEKFNSAQVRLDDCLFPAFILGRKRINAIIFGSRNFNMCDLTTFLSMCQGYIVINDVYLENTHEIAQLLTKERQQAGMTIKELAAISKVHSNIISAFEKETGTLRVDSFLAIANTLDFDITVE